MGAKYCPAGNEISDRREGPARSRGGLGTGGSTMTLGPGPAYVPSPSPTDTRHGSEVRFCREDTVTTVAQGGGGGPPGSAGRDSGTGGARPALASSCHPPPAPPTCIPPRRVVFRWVSTAPAGLDSPALQEARADRVAAAAGTHGAPWPAAVPCTRRYHTPRIRENPRCMLPPWDRGAREHTPIDTVPSALASMKQAQR